MKCKKEKKGTEKFAKRFYTVFIILCFWINGFAFGIAPRAISQGGKSQVIFVIIMSLAYAGLGFWSKKVFGEKKTEERKTLAGAALLDKKIKDSSRKY